VPQPREVGGVRPRRDLIAAQVQLREPLALEDGRRHDGEPVVRKVKSRQHWQAKHVRQRHELVVGQVEICARKRVSRTNWGYALARLQRIAPWTLDLRRTLQGVAPFLEAGWHGADLVVREAEPYDGRAAHKHKESGRHGGEAAAAEVKQRRRRAVVGRRDLNGLPKRLAAARHRRRLRRHDERNRRPVKGRHGL